MAVTQDKLATQVAYDLEGTRLEACSCGVLCPCWIGADPDGGACNALVAFHFERGAIRDVDVSGLSLVSVIEIPGNALTPDSWRMMVFIDERASNAQLDAIAAAYSGQLGGPLADLAGLINQVVDVRRAPVAYAVADGAGMLRVGDAVTVELAPVTGPHGRLTTLRDSMLSTVPGSPAYVAKASTHRVELPEYGMVWSSADHNAIHGAYKVSHRG